MPACDFGEPIHVARAAEYMNWQNGASSRRDRGFDFGRIDVPCIGLDVYKYGFGANVKNAIRRCNKTEGRRDNLVARTNSAGQHTEV